MRRLLNRLEGARTLDPAAGVLRRLARATAGRDRLRPALHGDWFGHPLHPAVVQFPVGAWMSAVVLDALPGRDTPGARHAATALVAAGCAGALPAVATGTAEYTTLDPAQRRVAVVHSAANATALGLFAASVLARVLGRHGWGRALSRTGLGVAGVGAYLGGHLTFAQGAGVQRDAGPSAAPTSAELATSAARH
ncbi:DUF2231 domain-containing protein [Dactylosporangium sp. CA-233914]|uniref:DUF2231 domain-containing protein n=1 Tax=Dactylosporangium sp. CA-233914 TaxID=3239934 RepID=UPI003D8B62B7